MVYLALRRVLLPCQLPGLGHMCSAVGLLQNLRFRLRAIIKRFRLRYMVNYTLSIYISSVHLNF